MAKESESPKNLYVNLGVDDSEPLMSVDKYYKPLVAKDANYITILLVRLILLEPGTFQTVPDCGVGLVSRYRYATDVDMKDLEERIQSQIKKYLPQFSLMNIRCELGKEEYGEAKTIKIWITSEEINVFLPIDLETGKLIEEDPTLTVIRNT
jgi:hypothetical protein